ncbi:MAG: RnfABCDGE type electron transport complex subunit D, partial [Candidatus Levyibacteriota bacterium]
LTLYYLIGLVLVAVILSFLGILQYSPYDILLDTLVTMVACYIFNIIFAKIFRAVISTESMYITALILVLIIPVKFPHNITFFLLASAFAMGSKYFVTIGKRHVFNPAAAAVAGIALLSPTEHTATWWVGTQAMLPFVIIGGLLVMRRIQRETMVVTFLGSYVVIVAVAAFLHSGSVVSVVSSLQTGVFHSALFFFTFVMLTEPLTSPTTKKLRRYYAMLVALLYATPQIRFATVVTPELALCIGNAFSYIVSPKYRFMLPLKEKIQIAANTYVFNFGKVSDFAFVPGQYMEWTLPHKNPDNRGNRRYFSLASSQSEDIQLMVRFYNPPSSYKKALLDLQPTQEIIATSLAGDFVMPKNLQKPLVFVAGGVGIAPFRSMLQSIIEKNMHVNITVLYANRTKDEIAFVDVLEKARVFGVNTIYTLTDKDHIPLDWAGLVGYFMPDVIAKYIPDFAKRIFYISGPQPMVQGFEQTLRVLHVDRNQIITDYFPGYTE